MIKTATQLKDLIRNLSKKKSADAQVLMRNYMMERFLERLSLSQYQNKFILKGGMLVAAMTGLDARTTMDMDATVKGVDVTVETVMAEKLETLISRNTANTRMRDFYDIYILLRLYGNVMDKNVLAEALQATARKRGTEYHLKDAWEIFDEVQGDHVMQKLWMSYRKKFSYAADISWEMVMKATTELYHMSEVMK